MRKVFGIAVLLAVLAALIRRRFVRDPLQLRVGLASINNLIGRLGLILVVRCREGGTASTVFSIENRRSYIRRSRLERRIVETEGRELDEHMERYTRALAWREGQRVQ